jgi:hypothetical protein
MAYSYAEVFAALARIYESDTTPGVLRGRIQNFQRLGIAPDSPGKGGRVSYQPEDVYKWAFCLELAELGLDPTVIAKFVSVAWSGSLREDLVEGGSKAAAARRASIRERREAYKDPARRKPPSEEPEQRIFWFRPRLLGKWPGPDTGPLAFGTWDWSDLRSNIDLFVDRAAFINLTRLHKDVAAALPAERPRDSSSAAPPAAHDRARRPPKRAFRQNHG